MPRATTALTNKLVKDGGYVIPSGYTGRVPVGMGPGPYLGTCPKTQTREYPDPHMIAGLLE
jgi:hypothetical protein